MAWTNIDDSFLEPGKPVRSADLIALRDNPGAIAGGASGAPKVVTGAMAANSIDGDRLAAGTTGAEKLQSGTAERNWVLGRLSTAAAGSIGSYAFLTVRFSDVSQGETKSGSQLEYSSTNNNFGGSPSGTWRAMGNAVNARATLFLRIS
jgi:hypothetical protein